MTAKLMLALYRSGRTSEALRAYQRAPRPARRRARRRPLRRAPAARDPHPRRRHDAARRHDGRGRTGGPGGPRLRAPRADRRRRPRVPRSAPTSRSSGGRWRSGSSGRDLADDPAFIRRFEADAELVARLEHPHIVPLYDYWREPGAAYRGHAACSAPAASKTALRSGPLAPAHARQLVRRRRVGAVARPRPRRRPRCASRPPPFSSTTTAVAYLGDFAIVVDRPVAPAAGSDAATSRPSSSPVDRPRRVRTCTGSAACSPRPLLADRRPPRSPRSSTAPPPMTPTTGTRASATSRPPSTSPSGTGAVGRRDGCRQPVQGPPGLRRGRRPGLLRPRAGRRAAAEPHRRERQPGPSRRPRRPEREREVQRRPRRADPGAAGRRAAGFGGLVRHRHDARPPPVRGARRRPRPCRRRHAPRPRRPAHSRGDTGIRHTIDRVLPDERAQLVLVIDQFEELFTQAPDPTRRAPSSTPSRRRSRSRPPGFGSC